MQPDLLLYFNKSLLPSPNPVPIASPPPSFSATSKIFSMSFTCKSFQFNILHPLTTLNMSTRFRRNVGAKADITISATSITLNQYKETRTTTDLGAPYWFKSSAPANYILVNCPLRFEPNLSQIRTSSMCALYWEKASPRSWKNPPLFDLSTTKTILSELFFAPHGSPPLLSSDTTYTEVLLQ